MRYKLPTIKASRCTKTDKTDSHFNSSSIDVSTLMQIYVDERSLYAVDRGQTARSKMKAVCRLLGHLHMKDIGQNEVDLFAAMRAAEAKSPHTVRSETALLYTALRYAADLSWRPPVASLKMPKVRSRPKRVLTPDEAHCLLRAADGIDCFRFIAIGLATGARMSAILELSWDRVRVEERIIDFRAPSFRADRKKHRAVVAVTDELLSIMGARQGLSGPVINASNQTMARHIRIAAKKAGLGKDVTAHTLRRTAATTIVKEFPIEIARRMLGHSYTQTTDAYYVNLSPQDVLKTVGESAKFIENINSIDKSQVSVQRSAAGMAVYIVDAETDTAIRSFASAKGITSSQAISLACKTAFLNSDLKSDGFLREEYTPPL
jgi:integrase